MEIKATTETNYKIVLQFYHFNMFKGKRYKWGPRFGLILTPLCLILIGYYYYITDDPFTLVILLIFCSSILTMLFLWFWLPKISYARANPDLKNIKNEYIFRDDTLSVKSNSENLSGTSEIKYSSLKKVYETDSFFYMYLSSIQAFVVDKSKIENGSVEDIRDKLSQSLPPKKYIICK